MDVRESAVQLEHEPKLAAAFRVKSSASRVAVEQSPADFKLRFGFEKPSPKDTIILLGSPEELASGEEAFHVWHNAGYVNVKLFINGVRELHKYNIF